MVVCLLNKKRISFILIPPTSLTFPTSSNEYLISQRSGIVTAFLCCYAYLSSLFDNQNIFSPILHSGRRIRSQRSMDKCSLWSMCLTITIPTSGEKYLKKNYFQSVWKILTPFLWNSSFTQNTWIIDNFIHHAVSLCSKNFFTKIS